MTGHTMHRSVLSEVQLCDEKAGAAEGELTNLMYLVPAPWLSSFPPVSSEVAGAMK